MSKRPHKFGGAWTEEKLRRVSAYLTAYTTALRKQPFTLHYVDAFAGTGDCLINASTKDEKDLFGHAAAPIKGSAQRALEVVPQFDKFLFIEKSKKKASQLEALIKGHPQSGKIEIIKGDANPVIREFCASQSWQSSRAVVFLDPFGMQVEWATIKALAATKSVDLWYLVPTGIGIARLLKKNGNIPDAWAKRLDCMLGDPDWRIAFYKEQDENTLFAPNGTTVKTKQADIPNIEAYLVKRLSTIFPYVAGKGLALKNTKGQPMFLLMFACANAKGGPIALRIAEHILKLRDARHGHN